MDLVGKPEGMKLLE